MDNKGDALEFLNCISASDKVGLVFHDDMDGFASGILLYDFLKKKGCKDIQYWIFSFGKTNKNDIQKKFEGMNKIIIADVAPFGIMKDMEGVFAGKSCLSIDHHKREFSLSDNFIDYYSEAYEPASRMVFELVGGKGWLALAGTISDAGDKYEENMEYIERLLEENNIHDVKEFRNTISEKLDELLIYFDENLYEAFERLKDVKDLKGLEKFNELIREVDSEIKKYTSDFEKNKEILGGIMFYYFNPKFSVKTLLATKISMKYPNEIFIFASLSDNGKITLSSRNQSRRVDMNDLMKKAVSELKDATGGGHFAAAGGAIRKQDLEIFKENLKKISV